MLNKLNFMYDLGVRAFAVFFDDISGSGANPEKRSEFLNRLNKDLVKAKGDVSHLIICPTENKKWWANHNPNTYLDILGDNLDKDIKIMWNGDKVMSDINFDVLDWVNKRVDREADLRTVNNYIIGNIYFGKKIILKNIKKPPFSSVKLICTNNSQRKGGFYDQRSRIYYYRIKKTLEKMIILSAPA